VSEVDLGDVDRALRSVVDPCSIATGVPISLPDMGLVQQVAVDDAGGVEITLCLTSPVCLQVVNIVEAVERNVGAVPGVSSARCRVDVTAQWMPDMMDAGARRRLRLIRPLPTVPA
jgi:metal-sulfur cluster biosynthetic enzyme